MSKLWFPLLKLFNKIGEISGCHQIPERCFKIKGYIFPICARCTGVIIGETVSIFLLCFKIKLSLIVNIVFMIIMGLDWVIQYIGIKQSTNIRRFITGILGGFSIINIYYYIISYLIKQMNI